MKSEKIAYTGIFAALYAVVGLIPAFPLIGSTSKMSFGEVLKPFNGIFLNPFYGSLATGIGAFILSMIDPSLPFGFAYFIVPTVGTLQAGLLAYKKWKEGATLLGGLILIWYCFDTGRTVWYYPFLHLMALSLIIFTGRKLPELLNTKHLFISLFIISFCATMTTHITGSIFFMSMYTPPMDVFRKAIYIYPVERVIFTMLSTGLCYGVFKGGFIDRDRWKLL